MCVKHGGHSAPWTATKAETLWHFYVLIVAYVWFGQRANARTQRPWQAQKQRQTNMRARTRGTFIYKWVMAAPKSFVICTFAKSRKNFASRSLWLANRFWWGSMAMGVAHTIDRRKRGLARSGMKFQQMLPPDHFGQLQKLNYFGEHTVLVESPRPKI